MAIVLLAAALRFTALSVNPPGLFRDELDKGYTAFCLFTLGQDQSGTSWPLFVRALQVTTSAVYEYLSIPFIAILGLSDTAVRIPAALAGMFAVLLTIVLGKKLNGPVAGLTAGILLACSPWHLLLSRWANQSILLTLWMPLGLWAWLHASDAKGFKRWLWLAVASLGLALTLYTYAPARMVVPLFCAFLAVLFVWKADPAARKKTCVDILTVFCLTSLLAIPLIRHVVSDAASGTRLSAITVFDGRPWPDAILTILSNYCAHFSPRFLFMGGDANPRHSIGFPASAHIVTVAGAVLGIWRAARLRQKNGLIVLGWLVFAPAAAACTNEGIPHALRAVMMLPALQLLAAQGLIEAQERWGAFVHPERPRATTPAAAIVLILFVVSTGLMMKNFWTSYAMRSVYWWEADVRALALWHQENSERFPYMVVSGYVEYPQPAFLFYGEVDPRVWIEKHEIPNVTFLPFGTKVSTVYRAAEKGTAYAGRAGDITQVRPEEIIRYPDGDPAWIVVGKPLE